MSSPCRRHGWGQSPRRLQSSIRRRQFNHEAKMCACTDIFARPSIAQPRIARKRRSRYDFAQGKIPSIFYHEAKMCARTDIFARPSIAQPRIARKRRSRYDFACGKIPSIFYHEAKMCARTNIFALPSMSHRAAYYAARAAARRRLLAFARSHVTIITHPTPSVNDAKLRAAITLSSFRNIIPLNTRKG